jgi:hypothetical protein
MKRSKVNDDGVGIAVMPMIGLGMSGPNPWRYSYTIAPHKLWALLTKPKASEHLEIAKSYTARQREIINMLVDRGLDFPEACEAAKNCDDEPAWL